MSLSLHAMEDEFRIPLERRITALRGHRDLLQDQLRDLHHELNSVDRRIKVAEEMYRQEFDAEPPDVKNPAAHPRRETRIRRANAGQMPWREAIITILRESGSPLHARDIWRKLQESGFQTDAKDPLRSVVAVAIRTEDHIRRVGPNTFALVNGADRAAHETDQLVVALAGEEQQ